MKKFLLVLLFLALYIIFIGRPLITNYDKMFDFHDSTVSLRIAEFSYNLAHFKIPPRMAPHFSFNLSYPVFNYYAPFGFWIGSFIYLTGIGIIPTLKLLFLLTLVLSFIGMFLFVNALLGFIPGIVSGVMYATSPWLAVELFIRGNLGELWFIALFPFVLWLMNLNAKIKKEYLFVITSFVISFLLTSHNIFALLSIPILIVYLLLLPEKKRNILALVFGFLLSSYFYIPLFLERGLVSTTEAIRETRYWDHFLCLWQLWTTKHWGYGGSLATCDLDAMSFMLGKWQILVGSIGFGCLMFLTLINAKINIKNRSVIFIKHKRVLLVSFLFLFLGIVSIFLTLYISRPVWDLFSSMLSMMQFPWRFNLYSIFSLALLSGLIPFLFKNRYFKLILLIFSMFLIVNNTKFFTKYELTSKEYNKKYFSERSLFNDVAFGIPDYFPKVGNLMHWWKYYTEWDITKKPNYILAKNTFISLEKDKKITEQIRQSYYSKSISNAKIIVVNIHYFPYWNILINGKKFEPKEFDIYARPIIKQEKVPFTIELEYKQTSAQRFGNLVTIITMFSLIIYLLRKNKSPN